MANIVSKGLLLVEDCEFGFDISDQERTGTQINAAYIPYNVSESIADALNLRYTSTYIDSNFASINGSILEPFNVKDGELSNEAVNLSQLNLKANTNDLDGKADLNGSATYRFAVADAINNEDAVNRSQLNLSLDLKEDKLDADAKFADVYIAIDTKADLNGSTIETFNVADAVNNTEAVNKLQVNNLLASKSDIAYVDGELDLKSNKDNVLELDNNTAYSPLFDYNPSTKKYVDDSINSSFQNGTSGTFMSQDNKTITVVNGLIVGII